jgi:hypothetical protein
MKKMLTIAAVITALALAGQARAEDPAAAQVMTPLEDTFIGMGQLLDYAEHCRMGADAHAYALAHLDKMIQTANGHQVPAAERAHLHELFVSAFNDAEQYWDIWWESDSCPYYVEMVDYDFPGIPNHSGFGTRADHSGSMSIFAQ